jgi:hypothetical protein
VSFRRLTRIVRRAAIATWATFVLALLVLWAAGLSRPRTVSHLTTDGRGVIAGQTYDGRLLLLYVHFWEARIDSTRTRVPDNSFTTTHTGTVSWYKPDGHRRAIFVPLIPFRRPNDGSFAGHYAPYYCDGTSVSLPFESGLVQFVRGRASTDERGLLRPDGMTFLEVVLPNWLVLAVFGGIPAVFMVRPAVRRLIAWRRPRGRCRACGYDLRMTPDRCPECGAVPKRPADDRRAGKETPGGAAAS